MSRRCKTVSFDLNDDYEIKLLNHAERGKFSKYIKELIREDINRMNTNITTHISNTQNQLELISEDVREAMSSFF